MRMLGTATAVACLLAYASPSMAQDNNSTAPSGISLVDAMKNPNDWAYQRADYALTGYSKLNQITNKNVKNLQVAWTFSTGVLRGHEGSPLVIGDVMYVHTPFPNIVYALDLNNEGKIMWRYTPKQDPACQSARNVDP